MGVIDATWGGLDVAIDTGPADRTGVIAATWGGLVIEVTADEIGAAVYDQDGVTWRANIRKLFAPKWRDEQSKNGNASFSVYLDDPAAQYLTDRAIVKFRWRGGTPFGGRISGEQCTHAVVADQVKLDYSIPGLLSILSDGAVLPDGGLRKDSPSTRFIGFMSPRAEWYHGPDWVRPQGVPLSADTTVRRNNPPELVASNPMYIAPPPGPEATQAAGTVAYYRRELPSNPVAETVKLICSGDNYVTVYVDGVMVVSPDYSQPNNWKQAYTPTFVLQPGKHVVAVKVENAARTTGANPLGFVGTAYFLNDAGEQAGVFFKTDTTHWWSSSQPVGWFPAQILHHEVLEAQADGAQGPSTLTLGFTPYIDSDGVPWSGDRIEAYALDVGKPLDQLATALTEFGMDVDVQAEPMVLDARNRRGLDVSATVTLTVDEGGNLVRYDTSRASTRFNVATAQLQDGTWLTVEDADAIAAMGGKVRAFVSLGSVTSPTAAAKILQQLLATAASPTVTSTAQLTVGRGPQLYRDVHNGYSVTTMDHREVGTIKQRVLVSVVDGSGPIVKTEVEMAVDPT
jgi:hypothetical protein